MLTVTYSCLLVRASVMIGMQVPASSMPYACYCLNRHCVLKSFVTPRWDSNKTVASTHSMYTCCCRHELSLFRTTKFQVESFITNCRIRRHQHQTEIFQATDAVCSDRMQDIRGVQAGLYSYAVSSLAVDSQRSETIFDNTTSCSPLP